MKNIIFILGLFLLSIPAIAGSGADSAVGSGFLIEAARVKCSDLKAAIGKESEGSKKFVLSEICKIKNEKAETEFKADSQLIVDEKGKLSEVKK